MVINCGSGLKSSELELLSEFCFQHFPRLYKQTTTLVVLTLKRMVPPSLNPCWARWHLSHYTNFNCFLGHMFAYFIWLNYSRYFLSTKSKQTKNQRTLIPCQWSIFFKLGSLNHLNKHSGQGLLSSWKNHGVFSRQGKAWHLPPPMWVGICFNCPISWGDNHLTISIIIGTNQLEWTQTLGKVRKCLYNVYLATTMKVVQYFNGLRCTCQIWALTTGANAGTWREGGSVKFTG